MKPRENGAFIAESSPFLDDTPLGINQPELESFAGDEASAHLETPWLGESFAAGQLMEDEAWSGSTEQIDFRERVLSAHIERSKKRRGAPKRDLRADELRTVRGTDIPMRADAADAAGRLLEAANQALSAATAAGDEDALRTTRITATSGYRGSEYQRKLWRSYFPKYYRRTRKDREALGAGSHSSEAVTYMLEVFGIPARIAAPGYSNHQAGIAIDLYQVRTPRHEIANDTDSASRAKWRRSWLHQWLIGHAGTFGFVPYVKEEWHWEYKPKAPAKLQSEESFAEAEETEDELFEEDGAGSGTTARDPAGTTIYRDIDLKIGTRTVQVLVASKPEKQYKSVQVSVKPRTGIFVPADYRAGATLDLVIYLHGHTVSYPGLKTSIDTYWADTRRWFPLRELVNEAGKNIVLAAPTLGPHSEAGTLDDAGGLDGFVSEVLRGLASQHPAFASGQPRIGNIILAGHSGAGKPMLRIAMSDGPMSAKIRECWLFDALYGGVSGWEKWIAAHPQGRFFSYHVAGAPRSNSKRLEKALRNAGITNAVIFPPAETPAVKMPGHFQVPKEFFAARLRDTSWLSEVGAATLQQEETPEWAEQEELTEELAEELDLSEDQETDDAELVQDEQEDEGDELEAAADEEILFDAETSFPSGESLPVITGLPEGQGQDYWDPTNSGNPLLDTGPAHKDKRVSANFTVRELTTSGGVSADVARIDPKLVQAVQRLRERVGKPITITSGYRSWKRNKQVYAGKTNPDGTPKFTKSQHCGGRAVDIQIKGMSGLDICKAAIDACGPNIGVGLGKTFAHVDVRGVPVAWNYGGVSNAWVQELVRYQKDKGHSSSPTRSATPAATASPSSARTVLSLHQKVPNKPENDTVGAIVKKITRNDPGFGQLVVNDNADIVFKDEEQTAADRHMTPRLKAKLDILVARVKKEWPSLKLRVTEAWDENDEHYSSSTHYEGRAADLTTSDRDKGKLGRLAALAVDAGLDWVFYEDRSHVHVSVKK